jgi:hypothetical protein
MGTSTIGFSKSIIYIQGIYSLQPSMHRSFIYLVIAIISAGPVARAQRFGPPGIGFKVGFSTNASSDATGGNNVALTAVLPSTSVVGFTSYRFKQDSAWHLFTHVKLALSASARGGVFDVNGTATRINMTFLDLDMLLPISIPVSENLDIRVAIGGSLAVKVRQNANTPKADALQPGIAYEMGMGTKHGSFVGFSLAQSFTTYPILNTSFLIAISVGDLKADAARRRSHM